MGAARKLRAADDARDIREVRIKLYTPHAGQWPIHQSRARFRVATAGRRFGKTMLCLNELAKHGWEHSEHVTWWVAPTYAQSKLAFRRLCRAYRKAFSEKPNKSELSCEWPSGSLAQFKSAHDADNLRGEGVHALVVDECGTVKRSAWEEALRPTLSDTGGWGIFIGTPKGQGHWFCELFQRGVDRAAWPDYESWQLATSANPYIPAAEIATAKRELPEDVFRQEYLAEFLEDGAGVFRRIRDRVRGVLLPRGLPGHRYVIGWDVGKRVDPSVMTVMDEVTGEVAEWRRYLGVEYRQQVRMLRGLSRAFGDAPVLMDSTGVGDPVFELARAAGLMVQGYHFTNTSKQQLVEHLVVAFEQADVWFPELPVLINELMSFQYEMTRSGLVRYNAPEGMHDDAVLSLALAAWARRHLAGLGLMAFAEAEARLAAAQEAERREAMGLEPPAPTTDAGELDDDLPPVDDDDFDDAFDEAWERDHADEHPVVQVPAAMPPDAVPPLEPDALRVACIGQGWVPPKCRLPGPMIFGLMNRGEDPCAGCEVDRNWCGGRPQARPGGANG